MKATDVEIERRCGMVTGASCGECDPELDSRRRPKRHPLMGAGHS